MGGSGAGATIDAITVNSVGSVVSVAWDNNGANYAAGDVTLTQTLADPAILGYGSEFILPTWGMVVTRFPDPATLQVKFSTGEHLQRGAEQGQFVRHQPHLIWVPPK